MTSKWVCLISTLSINMKHRSLKYSKTSCNGSILKFSSLQSFNREAPHICTYHGRGCLSSAQTSILLNLPPSHVPTAILLCNPRPRPTASLARAAHDPQLSVSRSISQNWDDTPSCHQGQAQISQDLSLLSSVRINCQVHPSSRCT